MAAQYSTIRGDEINYSFHLIFDDAGGVRLTRGRPQLDRRERAMQCNTTLPKSLFQTPELRATIQISDPASPPMKIDVEAASDALRSALGCDIDLKIVLPSSPPGEAP